MNISDDTLDQIGKIADMADNYAAGSRLLTSLPLKMHVESLTVGMDAISEQLKAIYQKISGENPWND